MKRLLRRVFGRFWRAVAGVPGRRLHVRLAREYLHGHGLEVGALDKPLEAPRGAKVSYVDRMSKADLLTHYPNLHTKKVVDVSVIDDGETLRTVADGSQDFVIACHFLEHCQDPIGTLGHFSRVLKPDFAGYVKQQSASATTAHRASINWRSLRTILLRDHMAPIARIAKVDLPQVPTIKALRLPAGRPTVERLAADAHGMAESARPYADVFIANGMPADFIDELNLAADAMVSALSDRSQSRGKRKGATTGLKTQLTEARKVVHVLDAFVKKAIPNDKAMLAEWSSVKRVGRLSRASIAAALSAATPPAAAPHDAPVEQSTVAQAAA